MSTNGKVKVDFLITAVEDSMLLSPCSEAAEAWVDEHLPGSIQVGDTITVHSELIDAVVDAIAATELRVVLWRTRVISGVRVNEVRADGVWVGVDERKALIQSLVRYLDAKHRTAR